MNQMTNSDSISKWAETPMAENAQKAIETARTELSEINERALSFIQERPVVAVLAAAGIGFLIARIASRL